MIRAQDGAGAARISWRDRGRFAGARMPPCVNGARANTVARALFHMQDCMCGLRDGGARAYDERIGQKTATTFSGGIPCVISFCWLSQLALCWRERRHSLSSPWPHPQCPPHFHMAHRSRLIRQGRLPQPRPRRQKREIRLWLSPLSSRPETLFISRRWTGLNMPPSRTPRLKRWRLQFTVGRPRYFRERVAKGDLSPMALAGAVASDGGVPILVNGKTIGAIGTSGGADDAVSQVGADALK